MWARRFAAPTEDVTNRHEKHYLGIRGSNTGVDMAVGVRYRMSAAEATLSPLPIHPTDEQ